MGIRKYQMLELVCNKCTRKHSVDTTEHPIPDSSWPTGWIMLNVQVSEHDLAEKFCFCPDHAAPVMHLVGHDSVQQFKISLEAQAMALKVNSPTQKLIDMLLNTPDKDPEGSSTPPIRN